MNRRVFHSQVREDQQFGEIMFPMFKPTWSPIMNQQAPFMECQLSESPLICNQSKLRMNAKL